MLPTMECQAHLSHCPEPLNFATHHILPLSWGGPDIPSNKVRVCATGHENIHTVLNWMVHAGGTAIPYEYRRRVGTATWAYAVTAWEQHHGPTPYTVDMP